MVTLFSGINSKSNGNSRPAGGDQVGTPKPEPSSAEAEEEPEPEPLGATSSTAGPAGPRSTVECVHESPPAGSRDDPETSSPAVRKWEESVGLEEEPESGKSR